MEAARDSMADKVVVQGFNELWHASKGEIRVLVRLETHQNTEGIGLDRTLIMQSADK